jgi:hypothetical protein
LHSRSRATRAPGLDVNLVHRLLKNHARELVGNVPYALVTATAARALELATDRMIAGEEAYDDTPPVAVFVLPLAGSS